MIKPGSDIRTAAPGDAITAREWNRIRTQIDVLRGGSPVAVSAAPRPWSMSMRHIIVAVEDNYLSCARMWRGSDLGTNFVLVAKPELLRESVVLRDGVSYVYITSQHRTASKSGETDEDQYVTPTYLVGDIIEVEVLRAITGVTEVDQQRGRPVDKNLDGRQWATLPP